ncbi:MAG: putative S-adenosylmethionine-dependent methyltransferase [Candidatus Lokiarchaeum sp. GC14_75]|nr:MAG: putative S-adenosylmethionine-dependent methyltransferase [Candidatus Lokiarchaeum sp. GC14_75]
MITPAFSIKTFNKIKRIFPIKPRDKIFLPIIINPTNLENFLRIFPNSITVSFPNYTIYSSILRNQFLAEKIVNNEITVKMDFFGIYSNFLSENATMTIILFPTNLALNLVKYALHKIISLSSTIALLIIVGNKKQNELISKLLELSQLEYSKSKSQSYNFYVIPKFNSTINIQSKFTDYTFKIQYKKNFSEFEFYSSDGVFSKDKVDDGTNFLIETVLKKTTISKDDEIIDYFSGLGVIGIVIAKKFRPKKIHFIESDIISLYLLKRNLNNYQIDRSVVHEMDGLEKPNIPFQTIDFIVANPPTHIRKEEFIHFLKISKDLLKIKGKLIIVINKIIPYEQTLKEFFPNPQKIDVYQKNNYKIIINKKIN